MSGLPESDDYSLVIRADFTDDEIWASVKEVIAQPVGEFRAYVRFVDDPQHEGLTIDGLVRLYLDQSEHPFVFLVDDITLNDPEHPVLVVDLFREPGRTFRVIPSQMWSVENNLSLANMDWEEFAEETDEDGVFRGFED